MARVRQRCYTCDAPARVRCVLCEAQLCAEGDAVHLGHRIPDAHHVAFAPVGPRSADPVLRRFPLTLDAHEGVLFAVCPDDEPLLRQLLADGRCTLPHCASTRCVVERGRWSLSPEERAVWARWSEVERTAHVVRDHVRTVESTPRLLRCRLRKLAFDRVRLHLSSLTRPVCTDYAALCVQHRLRLPHPPLATGFEVELYRLTRGHEAAPEDETVTAERRALFERWQKAGPPHWTHPFPTEEFLQRHRAADEAEWVRWWQQHRPPDALAVYPDASTVTSSPRSSACAESADRPE